MKKEDVEFSTSYCLTFQRRDTAHALVAWFDTEFSDLTYPVILSTAVDADYTHWKQAVFYLEKEFEVREGD